MHQSIARNAGENASMHVPAASCVCVCDAIATFENLRRVYVLVSHPEIPAIEFYLLGLISTKMHPSHRCMHVINHTSRPTFSSFSSFSSFSFGMLLSPVPPACSCRG